MAPPQPLSTDIFFHEEATQAWITQYALDIIGALPPLSIATRWWGSYAYVAPGSAPILRFPLNLQVPRMAPFTGRNNLQRGVTEWLEFRRGDPMHIGFQADIDRLRAGDFGLFTQQPAMIAHAMDIEPDMAFARALNAGFTSNDLSGKPFFVLDSAADADKKPVNAGLTALGTYTNARENFPFTSDNVSILIGDLNLRKGIDGRYLGYQDREVEIWVPPTKAEEAKQILERVEITFTSGTGGTARAYKRANYKVIPDMRTDLWIATVKPQSPLELPFVHMMGMNPNVNTALTGLPDWQIQPGEDRTPHREITVIDTNHPLYHLSRIVGYSAIQNETAHLLNGITMAAAFTGAAS